MLDFVKIIRIDEHGLASVAWYAAHQAILRAVLPTPSSKIVKRPCPARDEHGGANSVSQ